MTTPTGTALLAQASAEDLERDAARLVEMAGNHATRNEYEIALLRLAALARAVTKAERDGAMLHNTFVSGDTLPEHFANLLREAER